MKAMILQQLGSLQQRPSPLDLVDWPQPAPGPGEICIEVSTCGVCHTELDEIEGRTPPPRLPVIPGHQVIGRVAECAADVTLWKPGDRVGVGWIHSSSGAVDENLSPQFRATGRDANGGYAEFMTVPAAYAYSIPDTLSDVAAAPLMCAGGVGYRSLKLTQLQNGQRLGLTGFGGSGHLVLQMVRSLYPDSEIAVFARDPQTQKFAREQGADWAGGTDDSPPELLDAIIDTTPAWTPVVAALTCLKPGGRLVINAIRKEDADKRALLQIDYSRHLWMEREIKSVANVTAADLREFLLLAGKIPLRPHVETYPLAEANRALVELKQGPVQGAKVLLVHPEWAA